MVTLQLIQRVRLALAITGLVLACAPSPLRAQDAPFSGVARQTMANILKIPAADPDVSVTVQSTREEDGLVVQDISWESLDGQRPVAYVMYPANATGRLPAILFGHGSSGSRDSESAKVFGIGPWTNAHGKKSTRLLGAARELARRGYLVLSITHRGIDSRLPDTEDDAKDLLVHGRNLMGAEVYELRQAITYLRQRKEVDPKRIGMTGFSFGGITTFYTWLVDLRIAAAAPVSCAVGSLDTYLRLTPKRGYIGFTLWTPGMLKWGDQADFAAAMAPRPLMLWAPTNNISMPKEAVDRFIEVVQPAYTRAGAKDALVVHQVPGGHSFGLEAFAALNEFFDQHLKN